MANLDPKTVEQDDLPLLGNEYVMCDVIYYVTSTYAKHPHFDI
jgi:hypothetical protein